MRKFIGAGLLLVLLAAACAPAPISIQRDIAVEAAGESPAEAATQPVVKSPSKSTGVLLLGWNPTEQQQEIRAIDPATGLDVTGYDPIALGDTEFTPPYALSSDSRVLAAVEAQGVACEPFAGGSSCQASADGLRLVDLRTWQDTAIKLPGPGWVGPLAFSPDGSRLAVARIDQATAEIILYETESGHVAARQALDWRPTLMQYTQDSAGLAVYGVPRSAEPGLDKPDSPRVTLLNATTLKPRWEQALDGILQGSWCTDECEGDEGSRVAEYWQPAAVFSPDGQQLYIVHADADRLTTVDFSVPSFTTMDIEPSLSWAERLLALTAGTAEAKGPQNGATKDAVLSADGRQLFVVGRTTNAEPTTGGEWIYADEPLGLQVIDVTTRKIVDELDTEATGVRLTPDGSGLLLDLFWGEWTEVIDAGTLDSKLRLEGWMVAPALTLDGETILLASQPNRTPSSVGVFDLTTLTVGKMWPSDGAALWVGAR